MLSAQTPPTKLHAASQLPPLSLTFAVFWIVNIPSAARIVVVESSARQLFPL